MKNWKRFSTVLLALAVFAVPLLSASVNAQDPQTTALWRGYRTGYSDGYPAGASDISRGAPRNFRDNQDYQHADRGYMSSYGDLEEFRDGYQQGFEAGYKSGYDRRPFDSAVPTDIKRRSQADADAGSQPTPVRNERDKDQNTPGTENRPADNADRDRGNNNSNAGSAMTIQRDTIMRVELMTNLSSKDSKVGDKFQARVLEPKDFSGGVVSGRVTQVKRAGKVKGSSEIQLAFDELRMTDGRFGHLNAQVIEVIPMSNSQNVGTVDQEGGVKGKSSTKGDVTKIGAGVGIGAVIGAIAGGGAGAAIGAAIGGGVGTAGVLTERGSDIHLWEGQQLRLRTAGETTIQ